MNEQLIFEQVEKYLQGEMSKEESLAFELEMQKNEELKSLTEQTKQAMEAISLASLKSKMRQIEERLEREKIKTKKQSYLQWAAAAAILLLISIPLVIKITADEPLGNTLYAELYVKDPGTPTLMDQSLDYEFDDAMIDYKLGEYVQAIQKFQIVHRNHPENELAQLYLGLSYMANNEFRKATTLWQSWKPESEAVIQKHQWYLALIYIKTGDYDRASAILQGIVKNRAHPFYANANEALARIM
jgi:tetratricopeptide (TPR) repeat protein